MNCGGTMAKKTRGHRMRVVRLRAKLAPGGRGPIRSRPAATRVMST
jgi:hypothetical protein